MTACAQPQSPNLDTFSAPDVPLLCVEGAGLDIYKRRIEPLVNGSQINSCNQCHLSGMDLSMYVKESPCHTMACLIEQGLVDLNDPPSSPVLLQIMQADPASGLITEAVLKQEYDGFLEWIQHSQTCHESRCAGIANPCGTSPSGTPSPGGLTPLGSCQEEALIDLFDERVFEWRLRCHGCHSDCKPDYPAPCWQIEDFDKNDPIARREAAVWTMFNLIGLGAVNPDDPLQSLMLLKPLKEDLGGIEHGGGSKFNTIGDPAYQDYLYWLERYASCYNNGVIEKPTVSLNTPKYGKKYDWDEYILAHGVADDPQQGRLPEDALLWVHEETSTVVGSGEWLWLEPLPEGKQVISLIAIDEDGHIGSRSVTIRVRKKPEMEPEPTDE